MPLATFKDLCMDVADASVSGIFWAAALGLDLEERSGGNARLTGPTSSQTVWVNHVPEPKTVKHRIHVDIHGASVEDLVALGATVIDDSSFRWVVMADPEGSEFCLFVRDEVPDYRLADLNVDCRDHRALSAWWHALIGGELGGNDDGTLTWIGHVPNAPFDGIIFADVPEPKTVKNRVHLDVVAPSIGPIIEAGATLIRSPDDDIRWHVLADPEGNEFCVFDRF